MYSRILVRPSKGECYLLYYVFSFFPFPTFPFQGTDHWTPIGIFLVQGIDHLASKLGFLAKQTPKVSKIENQATVCSIGLANKKKGKPFVLHFPVLSFCKTSCQTTVT